MGRTPGTVKSYKKTNNSANAVVGCSHINFRMVALTPPPTAEQRDDSRRFIRSPYRRGARARLDFMPDLLRSVEIDDNLEFGRLLDRPIGGLRAPQYPIDITSPPAGMC
jgi:hypothetical protein